MSDSSARVHQRKNKQAIIFAAKNEIAKSRTNKAHYQLVYIGKQEHKSAVNTRKSQSCVVRSELHGLWNCPEYKLTCVCSFPYFSHQTRSPP